MSIYNQELVISNLFFIHFIGSFLSNFWIFEADESWISEYSLVIFLYKDWFNLSKLLEKFLQLSLISSGGQIANKQIIELGLLSTSWFFLFVPCHCQFLSF